MRRDAALRTVVTACLVAALILAACSTSPPTDGPNSTTASSAASAVLDEIPSEDRTAIGSGEPRSSGYWVVWSTCANGNQVETAAASGGREAGWILLDDILSDPGVSLGDHVVSTCGESLSILQTLSGTGPVDELARQLLTAELNLNAGSETCRVAAESVVVAHALLAASGYGGPEPNRARVDPNAIDTLAQLTDVLALYNTGDLCR